MNISYGCFTRTYVLVGTYRPINKTWIQARKLYNLPVNSETDVEALKQFSHLVLIYGNHKLLAFKANFSKVTTLDELIEKGYSPRKGASGTEQYALFELGDEECADVVLKDENSTLFTSSRRYTGQIDKNFFETEWDDVLGTSVPNIFRRLRPYIEAGHQLLCAESIQLELFGILGVHNTGRGTFHPYEKPKFTFIDLFAGIGGFRLAAQNMGGKCVFSSEFDANAQKTYEHNFGEVPAGDITLPSTKSLVPEKFDCLFGGFPCQPFSVAGYQRGFNDTRGTLFYDIAEIIKAKRPKVVFLENVKNLASHDHGNTFKVIKATLEELGYYVHAKVMNAMDYVDVPQNRERIFIVCFDKEQVKNYLSFKFPEKKLMQRSIHDCIDSTINDPRLVYTEKMGHYKDLVKDITDENSIYQWRRQYVRQNKSSVCPTLTANMGTGGHNVPLIIRNGTIRKLSPRECLNFQGFPPEYEFPDNIPMSAKYKQAGNSVVVPLIQLVCANIYDVIKKESE